MRSEQQDVGLIDQLKESRDEIRELYAEVSKITGDLAILAQKEKQLVQAEMREQVSLVTKAAGLGLAVLVLSFLTLVFLSLSLMFGLDTFLPLWAAAFITTVLLIGIAGVLGSIAYSFFRQVSPVPKKFFRSVGEDTKWLLSQMKLSAR